MTIASLLVWLAMKPVSCPAEMGDRSLVFANVIEVVNGDEGDLAPDQEKRKGDTVEQVWKLEWTKTNRFQLRCGYRDLDIPVTFDLSRETKACVKTIGPHNAVRMSCE